LKHFWQTCQADDSLSLPAFLELKTFIVETLDTLEKEDLCYMRRCGMDALVRSLLKNMALGQPAQLCPALGG